MEPFFLNVMGAYRVCNVTFKRYSEDNGKYAVIEFPEVNRIVWCEKSKVFTGSNLYQCFLTAGINFYGSVSTEDIKKVLQSTFIGQIQSPMDTLCIEEMAGWNHEWKWQSAKTYSFPGMLFLPCVRKKFPCVQKDKKQLEQFFSAFAEIENCNYRIIIMETLVYGLLSSILAQEGWTERYFLNFVLLESITEERFCRLYQVFDRERYSVINAAEKRSGIVKMLREINDEVFILSMPKGKGTYKQKKAEEFMDDVIHKICDQDVSSLSISWKVNAALVVLNHQISDSLKAINILTDTSVFSMAFVKMLKSSAVDNFLSSFVRYVEEHMQEVKKVIKRYKEKSMSGLLSVLWMILKMFCRENEIDLHKLTKVEENQSFYTVVNSLMEKTALDEMIIMIIRDSMKQSYVQEKRYGCKYIENCCYWDAEYYFIPTKIFRNMMKENNIMWNRVQMTFLQWKDAKLLLPDDVGFTYRFRLDGQSIEAYRFKRELFDRQLDIELKDLGKELE